MASVSEILLARGQQAANARRREGQASAETWRTFGDSIGSALMGYAKQKEQEPILRQNERLRELQLEGAEADAANRDATAKADGAFSSFLNQWDGSKDSLAKTATAIYGERGIEKAGNIWKGFEALNGDPQKKYRDTQTLLKDVMVGMNDLPEDVRASVYPNIRQGLVSGGVITEQDAPPEYDPAWWQSTIKFGEKPTAPVAVEGVGPDGNPQTQFVVPEVGTTVQKPAPKLTYSGPQWQLVDGKKTLVRPASDGSMRDLKGVVIEPQRISPVPEAAGRQGLTPNMESTVISRLANQWTAAAKPTRELDRQVGIMNEGIKAAEAGNLAQGGQAVLVTFQKILDPTSVVRESEFDRSREGQSLLQRARGAVERLTVGGPGVPLSELKKYADLAKQIASAQKDSRLKAIQERIGKTADRYTIPRELVFEAEPEPAQTPAQAATPSAGGMIEAKDKDGNIHHAPAGTPLPDGWTLVSK